MGYAAFLLYSAIVIAYTGSYFPLYGRDVQAAGERFIIHIEERDRSMSTDGALELWLNDVASLGPEPDNLVFLPTDELLNCYVETIEARSEADVVALLGRILFSSIATTIDRIRHELAKNVDEFVPYKSFIQRSVTQLESQEISDMNKAMIHVQSTLGQISGNPKAENAGVPVWIYGRADAYRDVLEAIRQRFTQLLLDRLPRIESPASEDA